MILDYAHSANHFIFWLLLMDQAQSAPDQNQQPPAQKLSLKEKYFQIEPEGRIRRYQYFVRSIVPTILLMLVLMIGWVFAVPLIMVLWKLSFIIGLVLSGWLYWMFYNLAKVNSIKRAHDFGSDGKIVYWVVTASFIFNILGLLVWVLQGFGVLPTADISSALDSVRSVSWEDPLVAMRHMSDPMKDATPFYEKLLWYLSNIVWIASFITWIFLLFRPGVAWDNQYGKDSASNKVWFLG